MLRMKLQFAILWDNACINCIFNNIIIYFNVGILIIHLQVDEHCENSIIMTPNSEQVHPCDDNVLKNGHGEASSSDSWIKVALIVERLFCILYFICVVIILTYILVNYAIQYQTHQKKSHWMTCDCTKHFSCNTRQHLYNILMILFYFISYMLCMEI